MIYLFLCTLLLFSISSGLKCKTCIHISHETYNMPQDKAGEIEEDLRKFENKDCLFPTIKPEKNETTCDTPQEVNTGSAKCITAHVVVDAKGRANLTKDATLRIHFYGRNCIKSTINGCEKFESSVNAFKHITHMLEFIVKGWPDRTYRGEICYHDDNAPFRDLGSGVKPELIAKPKILEP